MHTNHQLVEIRHARGTISVYTTGIVLQFGDQEVFLGEEILCNYDLFCSFLDLANEGIVQSFGGFVVGDEGQPIDRQFLIRHLLDDVFVVTDDDDDGLCFTVDLDFLERLCESCGYVFVDGCIDEDIKTEDWSIRGSFPWSPLTFAISEVHFEISVPSGGNIYLFATEFKDRDLWSTALVVANKMLTDKLLDGSWKIVRSKKTDKAMRLEIEEGRILFSLDDPAMPEVGVTLSLDDLTMYAIELLLETVWELENGEDRAELAILLGDDENEDDEEEGSAL